METSQDPAALPSTGSTVESNIRKRLLQYAEILTHIDCLGETITNKLEVESDYVSMYNNSTLVGIQTSGRINNIREYDWYCTEKLSDLPGSHKVEDPSFKRRLLVDLSNIANEIQHIVEAFDLVLESGPVSRLAQEAAKAAKSLREDLLLSDLR